MYEPHPRWTVLGSFGECLWMDADRNMIGAHSFSDMTLTRVHGRWLVKTIRVGKVEKL